MVFSSMVFLCVFLPAAFCLHLLFTWDAGQKFFACSGKSGLLCIRRTDLCNITGCFIGGQLYFSAPDRGMSEDP